MPEKSLPSALDFIKKNKDIQKTITKSIENEFPIESGNKELRISDVYVDDNKKSADFKGIKDKKLKRRTWEVPVYGKAELIDKETGETIDKRDKFKIARIPKMTPWFSTVIDGNEYQTTNQLRLKSGVYTREKNNGNFESRFNLEKGWNFRMVLPPEKEVFFLVLSNRRYSLYAILQALGVSDQRMKQVWGRDIFDKNKEYGYDKEQSDVINLYKKLSYKDKDEKVTYRDAVDGLKKYLDETKVSPETTKVTLGVAHKKVTPEALLDTSKKLLRVMTGEEETDQRESLEFKNLLGVEDLLTQYFDKNKKSIQRKLKPRLNKYDDLRSVLSTKTYTDPVRKFFTTGDLSSVPDQSNPAKIIADASKTTVMGSGGIKSTHAINDEVRQLHPSHLNFVDSLATPECFGKGTDILTLEGWKDVSEITKNDKVACQIDGRLDFKYPDKVRSFDYDGPMYKFKNSKIHLEVTKGHDMWVDILNKSSIGFRKEKAEISYKKNRLMHMGHQPYEGNKDLNFIEIGKSEFNIVDWCSLLGWFLSEGSTHVVTESTNWTCAKITQPKEKNRANFFEIQELLEKLNIRYTINSSKKKETTSFLITEQDVSQYFLKFGKSYDKYIPKKLFKAPVEAREALFESLMKGDDRKSFYKSDGSFQYNNVYTTTSPQLAKDVLRLGISLGYAVTHKIYPDKREERYLDVHEVRLLKHDRTKILTSKGHTSKHEFSGTVYGITVPGGLLLAKIDNSSPVWTGNSGKVGVNMALAQDTIKDGTTLKSQVYKMNGESEALSPSEYKERKIAFPEEFEMKDGKPVLKNDKVKVYHQGEVQDVPKSEVDGVMPSSNHMFGYITNLIPYMEHNSGNRGAMAHRMIGQALPIESREEPLVQTRWRGDETYQDLIGKQLNVRVGKKQEGKIDKIDEENKKIYIKTKDGSTEDFDMFDDFPLNQESYVNQEPIVEEGDEVKEGDVLTDNNFTKNGKLALGANVNTAWMPFKGLTFEDSAVVSEDFADKFTSTKMVREDILVNSDRDTLDKDKFMSVYPGEITPENAKKLDERGIIKEGETVQPGEAIAVYLQEKEFDDTEQRLKRMHRGLARPYNKKVIEWDDDFPGKIKYVRKSGKNIDIHAKVKSPLVVGDKISGLAGNKSIVSRIIPNEEMPKTKDGEKMDLIFSPVTVPGRMNIAQLVEAGMGKYLDKTDKDPVKIDNFSNENALEDVKKKLEDADIPVEEQLYDGKTGKPFKKKTFWGKPYTLKLKHVVEHKLKSRNTGGYDINEQPSRGGDDSGQTFGRMEVMAGLAHGAKENLKEMAKLKSQKNDEYWRKLQLGLPTPIPKKNFAFDKMTAYLKQAGIDVEKKGDKFTLLPLTDKKVEKISAGEVKDGGHMLRGKDLREIKGGLFDPELLGGLGGEKWGHMSLYKKIPNPVLENAVSSVLDLKTKDVEKIVSHDKKLNGETGPEAIEKALSNVDLDEEMKKTKDELRKAPKSKVNKLHKKARYLQALKENDLEPSDYMISKIPIIPPKYRPVFTLPSGDINVAPINKHYKDTWLINDEAKKLKEEADIEDPKNDKHLYRATKALQGLIEPQTYSQEKYEGALKTLAGSSPKHGFIHNKLFSKKQDFSARSTIGLEPNLGMDEAELPDEMAKTLYEQFVIRHMVKSGMPAKEAKKEVEEWTPHAEKVLDLVMEDRPVILNRAPTLHKHGLQALKPKRTKGKTIKLNPLILSGFGADFDGDTMAVHLPISDKAKDESWGMLPSKNLFKHGDNAVVPELSQEYQFGLYFLSQKGKDTGKEFDSIQEAKKADLDMTDVFKLNGKETTLGREALNASMPSDMEVKKPLDRGEFGSILDKVAKDHPKDFPKMINNFKDLGKKYSYERSGTISLSDFSGDRDYREKIFKKYEPKVKKAGTDREKAKLWTDALTEIKEEEEKKFNNTNPYEWLRSGGWSGSKAQNITQILSTPGQVPDSEGNPIPGPIKKSYGEGLDTSDYWKTLYGVRQAMINSNVSTAEPGALSKEIMGNVWGTVINSDDCGTKDYTEFRVKEDKKDVIDRCLAKDIPGVGRRNDVIDDKMYNDLIDKNIKIVKVRTPLDCEDPNGVCKMCYGVLANGQFPEKGYNIGITEGHALSEASCNHAKSYVIVDGEAMTFEMLFEKLSDKEIIEVDGQEVIDVSDEDIQIHDGGSYVKLNKIARHIPNAPMKMIKTEQQSQIVCQANHPIPAYETLNYCSHCGYALPDRRHPRTVSNKTICSNCGLMSDTYFDERLVEDDYTKKTSYNINLRSDFLKQNKDAYNNIRSIGNYKELPLTDYWFGFYLAEGSIIYADRKDRKIPGGICITQKPNKRMEKLAEENPEYDWGCDKHKGGWNTYRFYDMKKAKYFEDISGRYSHQKHIPNDFLNYEDNKLLRILSGIIDGDGYFDKSKKHFEISSNSYQLIQQISLIGSIVGFNTVISISTVTDIMGFQSIKIVCHFTNEQIEYMKNYSDKIKNNYKKSNDFKYEEIEDYSRIKINNDFKYEEEFVYDVETESGLCLTNTVQNHNTQLILSSKHSSGMSGGKGEESVIGGLPRFNQLLEVPKTVPNKATLSPIDGIIKDIQKSPIGGYYVQVNDRKVTVPPKRDIIVEVGDQVEKGDKISSGVIKPQEYAKYKGHDKAQRLIVQEMDDLYNNDFHKKTFETVVRAVSNNAEVSEAPDDAPWIRGDKVTIPRVKYENKKREKEGLEPIKYKPYFRSTAYLPQDREDWLSKAGTSRIIQGLEHSVATGAASNIHGNDPVPAYLYGKEFAENTDPDEGRYY